MARRLKAAAAGKRGPPAALLGPPSSEDEADEAPEQVSFGVAKEAAETQRKLVGEAARRHRELLKEKRRRRQELFAEQKKRKLLPEAVLQELAAAPPAGLAELGKPALATAGISCVSVVLGSVPALQGFTSLYLTRSKGNYTAVCLKEQSLTPGLQQQLAKDFINTQLYGPGTNRVQANEFFSLENKKNPVKKAAVQFVDKSWGEYKNSK
ncbi:NOL7 protein, partial [Chordeiles acutipennis]|nr:NOL7 protein [Chordeiles acutipennis]